MILKQLLGHVLDWRSKYICTLPVLAPPGEIFSGDNPQVVTTAFADELMQPFDICELATKASDLGSILDPTFDESSSAGCNTKLNQFLVQLGSTGKNLMMNHSSDGFTISFSIGAVHVYDNEADPICLVQICSSVVDLKNATAGYNPSEINAMKKALARTDVAAQVFDWGFGRNCGLR